MNTPSPMMQSKVVAVPMSTTIVSRANRRVAASVLMSRSAPTVSGSSTSTRMGSGACASTTITAPELSVLQAATSDSVTRGTTDPTAAPSMPSASNPSNASSPRSRTLNSSAVRSTPETMRQCPRIVSLSKSPIVVSVFPTSKTSIMRYLLTSACQSGQG